MRWRCPECGGRLRDHIPADIKARAERAGVNLKHLSWYAGRLQCPTSAAPKRAKAVAADEEQK